MPSSDGRTRDLVSTINGSGWDYSLHRHPYHHIEAPLGPHYCVYNRRLMACCFDKLSTADSYWQLRRQAAVLNTGEYVLQFEGPDAERLLDNLFTKDITAIKPGRCGYGLACYDDGGLLVDGILIRLSDNLFWYAQADGDFYSWARAHATGLDVSITDPQVFVSQVQGPASLQILEAAADDGMPEPFTYFGMARVKFGGQSVVITRTGYTNELGWEYYTEPGHDADALWNHLNNAGRPFGMSLFGLDAMHIRRIEAGILNAGSDFDHATRPHEVGLGRFVDEHKGNFIGRDAIAAGSKDNRLSGIYCTHEPHIGGEVVINGETEGKVTAGAVSPYLGCGVGIVLLDKAVPQAGAEVSVRCVDDNLHPSKLAALPLYDKNAEIPRGKNVDIPQGPVTDTPI
ncbi:MAG: aminomethyltransferase family protein [Pseudomonadota bacterium]